jgi:acetoin utilization deacetylase AcuC-like enzyme
VELWTHDRARFPLSPRHRFPLAKYSLLRRRVVELGEGDRLGRLSLTKAGLRARDALVLDRLRAVGANVCVVLAGGYAEDVRDTVEINAATATAVAARMRQTPHVAAPRGWEAHRSPN